MKISVKWLKRGGWLVYGLWHLLFVIVAVALLLPYITLPMINSVRIGAAPLHYAVYVSLVVTIPFLSLVIVWFCFRKNVVAALKLFYAVELPLMLLLLLKVVLFRDAPFAAQLVLVHIGIGITAYFAMLWFSEKPTSQCGEYFHVILSTLVALVGVYLAILLGLPFLAIMFPAVAEIWQVLLTLQWPDLLDIIEGVARNPMVIIYILLFCLTALFFLTTPLILIISYLHQFMVHCRNTPVPRLLIVVFSLVLVEIVIFRTGNIQPQIGAFELTKKLPSAAKDQRQLMEKDGEIREGLLNGYLASYRYLSTTGSSRSIRKHLAKVIGFETKIPEYAQNFFNLLAGPFLYEGKGFDEDKELAALRYQEFFDTPIEKRERESILEAVKATWEDEQNEAGLMNAASHYVLLKDQWIEIKEHGDFATVSITQILENQTFQAQEVVVHFALPEEAVITGLWMSDDRQDPEKFRHVVSPRGAAQSVYKSEVQRRIDPALLEQVGPLQYRLRAFPIPARVVKRRQGRNRYSNSFKDFTVAPALVRFQYQVSIDEKGGWPMPELLEKRNLFWNDLTKRSHKPQTQLSWLPARVKALQPNRLKSHSVKIGDGIVQAVPREKREAAGTVQGPVAIIVDGSYSMNEVKKPLEEQLKWVGQSHIDYELFFCQSACRQIEPGEIEDLVYFGNSQLLEQLSQWTGLFKKDYSSIFVLSDAGSYELSPRVETVFKSPPQPLWLVHLSEKPPYAYDDKVIDGVNDSGGGIAKTLDGAMEKFLWSREVGQKREGRELMGVSEGYFWYWLENDTIISRESDAFTALAAGQLIKYIAAKSDKSQMAILDSIHAIAKENDIVSFYSSMLVLVEDRQRQLLQEAEAGDDRFEREIETGKETLSKPTDPFAVPGVPEPEEWALLLIAGLLLLVAYRRRVENNYYKK